jgi:hypothetical protein
MDKGIRPFVNAKFAALLPTRVNTREGNTLFRKTVMHSAMEEFGITLASAATHYNHAFIEARKAAETDPALATLLQGLGRPEDKKGGRKPKQQAAPVTPSIIPVPTTTLLQQFLAPAAPAATLISQGIRENTATHTITVNPVEFIDAQFQEQAQYKVCKKADGSVVAEGLSFDDAKALVEAAAKAKKAKLYWV